MLPVTDTDKRYGLVSMALHWIIAACLLGAYMTGEGVGRDVVMTNIHASLSILAVLLVFVRIAWRVVVKAPTPMNDDARLMLAQKVVMGVLAILAPIALIVSGTVILQALGHNLPFFGVDIVQGYAVVDRPFARFMKDGHEVLSSLFMLAFFAHFGAAFWHHVIKKDNTFKRMVPWGKVG